MGNASFHLSDRIKEMCSDAGVKLIYLPPYSPDLNPIEEIFSNLKPFIRHYWQNYEQSPIKDSIHFLRDVLKAAGSRERGAIGHFRHAGVVVENYH
jgi:transposase